MEEPIFASALPVPYTLKRRGSDTYIKSGDKTAAIVCDDYAPDAATAAATALFIQDACNSIAQLRAELAQSKKDAERYLEVRRSAVVTGIGWMFKAGYKSKQEYAYLLKGKEATDDCDACVDAAIDAAKGQNK